MLSMFAKPPPPPLPAPGVLGWWSHSDIAEAMRSGNCTPLMGPAFDELKSVLAASPNTQNRHSLFVTHGQSSTAWCGGLVSFASTLLLVHPRSVSVALFSQKLLLACAPHVPRGALACAARPTLDSLSVLRETAHAVDAENRERWFYQSQLTAFPGAASTDAVVSLLVVLCDVLRCSGEGGGHHVDRDHAASSTSRVAVSGGNALLAVARESTLCDALSEASGALERHAVAKQAGRGAQPTKVSTTGLESVLGSTLHVLLEGMRLLLQSSPDSIAAPLDYLVAAIFDGARACGRHIRSPDVGPLLACAADWLCLKVSSGTGRSKRSACRLLASLWKADVAASTSEQLDALCEAADVSQQGGTQDQLDVVPAAIDAMGEVFSAATFPTVLELSGLFTFLVRAGERTSRKPEACACARLATRWIGLASRHMLPVAHSAAIQSCALQLATATLDACLRLWPSPVDSDRDEAVVDTVAEMAALLHRHVLSAAADPEPRSGVQGTKNVDAAALCSGLYPRLYHAATRTGYHYLPPVLNVLWGVLEAPAPLVDFEGSSGAQVVSSVARHIERLLDHHEQAHGSSRSAAATAYHAGQMRTILDAYLPAAWHRFASVSSAVQRTITRSAVHALLVASRGGSPWAALSSISAHHLSNVVRSQTEDGGEGKRARLCLATSLSLFDLQRIGRAYNLERGWLSNGPAVAVLEGLFAPDSPFGVSVGSRSDVLATVGWTPSTKAALNTTLLCLQRRTGTSDDAVGLPLPIQRCIQEFGADPATVDKVQRKGPPVSPDPLLLALGVFA